MKKGFTIISSKQWDENQIWQTVNASELWANADALLQEVNAELIVDEQGEYTVKFIADGKLAATPIRILENNEEAYLIEVL